MVKPSMVDRRLGAMMMLEAVMNEVPFNPSMRERFWEAYLKRVRIDREQAICRELAGYRFCLLERAGRDLDWIRSYRRYGVPPVPD